MFTATVASALAAHLLPGAPPAAFAPTSDGARS
jgi:hypothetical protein